MPLSDPAIRAIKPKERLFELTGAIGDSRGRVGQLESFEVARLGVDKFSRRPIWICSGEKLVFSPRMLLNIL